MCTFALSFNLIIFIIIPVALGDFKIERFIEAIAYMYDIYAIISIAKEMRHSQSERHKATFFVLNTAN